jgi:hypothetical protein
LDVVFFLKAMPTDAMRALDWPAETKLVGLNPNKSGEPTSADYSALAASLKGSDGRILPNLLEKYAKVDEVGRVAFLGFSAAHGFLDPYARNDEDRAATSAYILMDATFDGFGAQHGKPGYVAFAEDAVDGDRLLWTATANSATWDPVAKKATHLTGTESWELVWNDVLEATGRSEKEAQLRDPLPEPAGGAHQLGQLLFWYEYVNSDGSSQIAHTDMGKLITPAFEAYLIPWWKGELGGSKALLIGAAIAGAAGAAWLANKWLRRRRAG